LSSAGWALAGGALLTGCGTTVARGTGGAQHTTASVTTPAPDVAAGDRRILQSALTLERRTVAAV
jgi:hypothetical protein